MEKSHGALIVVWADGLRLYRLDQYPREGFVVGGSLFTPHQPGKFLYLYDWILQPDGQVCGVQFTPDGEAFSVASWLGSRAGVRTLEGDIFQIFFPGFSVDSFYIEEAQDIADDVFEGTNGSFALALELVGIEAEAVRRLGAKTPVAGTELAVIDAPRPSEKARKEQKAGLHPKFHIPLLGRLFGLAEDSSGRSRENEGPSKG